MALTLSLLMLLVQTLLVLTPDSVGNASVGTDSIITTLLVSIALPPFGSDSISKDCSYSNFNGN